MNWLAAGLTVLNIFLLAFNPKPVRLAGFTVGLHGNALWALYAGVYMPEAPDWSIVTVNTILFAVNLFGAMKIVVENR